MDTRLKTAVYLFLLAAGLATATSTGRDASGMTSVSMLDVGQGDSFLIQSAHGTQLLIDGGPDASVLFALAEAMPPGDRTIDVILATHPDADHIGGLPAVLGRYDVSLFLASKVYADSEAFRSLYAAVADRGIPAYFVRRGMAVSLDAQASLAILFPDRDTSFWETNTASAIGRLDVGNASILFTGDAPASVEQFLAVLAPGDVAADILKLAHHGSKTSTGEPFLRAVSPSLALISAGRDNRYGHPAKEVLERLEGFGIPYVSTQDVGTHTLYTDGEGWYGD